MNTSKSVCIFYMYWLALSIIKSKTKLVDKRVHPASDLDRGVVRGGKIGELGGWVIDQKGFGSKLVIEMCWSLGQVGPTHIHFFVCPFDMLCSF